MTTTELKPARAVRVQHAGDALALSQVAIPEPGPHQVRIRVHACGICHSDAFAKNGGFPGVAHPLVPGHEVVGVVDALGAGARPWTVGERVGLGWYGGACGWCEPCRRGSLMNCRNLPIPGITTDGGYADYVIANANALAKVPDTLSSADAAPLMCAGVTTFNALRHSDARAGDTVAILGLGGLGHLGVQYAAAMGFRTIAIARGAEKASFAKELGAETYIDSTAQNVAEELLKAGGAKLVLATVTASDAMAAAFGGLGVEGTLLIVGASMDPLGVPPAYLIGGNKTIAGWASGLGTDSQDTLDFSARHGIRPRIERYALDHAQAGFDRMISGAARFRVVLETGAA